MTDIDEAELRRQLAVMRMSRDAAEARLAEVEADSEHRHRMYAEERARAIECGDRLAAVLATLAEQEPR